MIAQDLWEAPYEILFMVLLKEFIQFIVNMEMIIKKCGTCRAKYNDCKCFCDYAIYKDDSTDYWTKILLIEPRLVYVVPRIIKKKSLKKT